MTYNGHKNQEKNSGGYNNNKHGHNQPKQNNNNSNNYQSKDSGIYKGEATDGYLYRKVITPGQKKVEQCEDLISGLSAHSSANGMERMSTIILNLKDIPESEIMPRAPDESKFATTIEVDAMAPDGTVYKHKNGKNIKKKIRIVTDEAKEKDVMDTYKYKKELAIKEIEKYKKDKVACIFLLKGQIHPEVWLQCNLKESRISKRNLLTGTF